MTRSNKFEQIVRGMNSVSQSSCQQRGMSWWSQLLPQPGLAPLGLQVLDVPLTVKIRTGVQEKINVAHKIIPKIREWGASMVTVRGCCCGVRFLAAVGGALRVSLEHGAAGTWPFLQLRSFFTRLGPAADHLLVFSTKRRCREQLPGCSVAQGDVPAELRNRFQPHTPRHSRAGEATGPSPLYGDEWFLPPGNVPLRSERHCLANTTPRAPSPVSAGLQKAPDPGLGLLPSSSAPALRAGTLGEVSL